MSFPFRETPPPPIKESSTPVSAPIKSFTCPDGASAIAAPPPRSHSLALFTAHPLRGRALTFLFCVSVTGLKDDAGSRRCSPTTAALFLPLVLSPGFHFSFCLFVAFSEAPPLQQGPSTPLPPFSNTSMGGGTCLGHFLFPTCIYGMFLSGRLLPATPAS